MKKSMGSMTLAYPLPSFLIGTYDENKQANIMTAAWGGIASSEPPCISISIRPSRWTHAAIVANKAFTVNIPNAHLAAATDYAGIVSGKNHNKFTTLGLTAVKSELVNAPYVDECPVILECELYKNLELGTHTLFVGKILDVKANENCFGEKGIDIFKVDPILYDAGGQYHRIGEGIGQSFSIGKSLK